MGIGKEARLAQQTGQIRILYLSAGTGDPRSQGQGDRLLGIDKIRGHQGASKRHTTSIMFPGHSPPT